MLQRIQTVFLLMVASLMTIFLFFPLWFINLQGGAEYHRLYAFFYYGFVSGNSPEETVTFWPYAISGVLAVIATIIAIFEAFSYKNRLTQIKLGALNSLVMAGALISAVWFTSDIQQIWEDIDPGQFGMGVIFPAIALLCNIFANRFIRKDEKLVKSIDRVR